MLGIMQRLGVSRRLGASQFVQPAIDAVMRTARDVAYLGAAQANRGQWPRSDREPAWRHGGRFGPAEVRERAARAARPFDRWIDRGRNPEMAAGLASNSESESRSNHRQRQEPAGPGHGLMQWDEPRRGDFERMFGIPFAQSTKSQQLDFIDRELAHPEYQASGRREIPSQGHAALISTAILNN